MSGSLSNPLLVLPLVTTAGTSDSFSAQTAETSEPKVSNIVGAGFNEYEAMILKKLQEVK